MDKHFILTHGRSGSNFLANSFNKHPSLVNYGEVLGEWTLPYRIFPLYEKSGSDWADFLDRLYSSDVLYYAANFVSSISHLRRKESINFKRKASIKSLGMKDFVFLMDERGLRDYLVREDIKVIYLTRRNHFSRYLSLLNMGKSGIVKTENKVPVHNQYTINIDEMLTNIKHYKKEEESGDQMVQSIPTSRLVTIEYEDYFSDTNSIERTHSMLFDFLGVEDIKVASSQKKILTKDPREYITNYADVASAMKQAGYQEYLM